MPYSRNDKFNAERNFSRLKFGKKKLGEIELNEMQKTLIQQIKNGMRLLAGDGFINVRQFAIVNNELRLDADGVIINGQPIFFPELIKLTLPQNHNLLYVYFKVFEVEASYLDSVPKHGNRNSGVLIPLSDIYDNELEEETARRVQVQYQLVAVGSQDTSTDVKLSLGTISSTKQLTKTLPTAWLKPGVRFRTGLEAELLNLDLAEPALTLDTERVFLGRQGNVSNIELAQVRHLINEEYLGIPAEWLGIKSGDCATNAANNTQLLNNFLATATNSTVIFKAQEYCFNDTITVTKTNKLKGTPNTLLRLITNNVDFIRLKPLASIESLRLRLFANHTKACISLKDDDFMQWSDHYLHSIKDCFIYGDRNSQTSIGIELFATAATHSISNVLISNVTIMMCRTGISIDKVNGWCNGNFFDNVYLQGCIRGIHIGKDIGGNRFLYQLQYRPVNEMTTEDIAVFCEGYNNIFLGTIWETPPYRTMIELTASSTGNNFIGMDFGRNTMNGNVRDDGQNNVFPGFTDVSRSIPQTTGAYVYSRHDPVYWDTARWQQFYGAYSNILHNAHKIHNVTFSLGGSEVWYGEIGDVFNRDNQIVLKNTPVTNPIVIEIVFNRRLERVPELGITFDYGLVAKYVKFEYKEYETDANYKLLHEIKDNTQYFVTTDRSTYGGEFSRLRITIADGFAHALLNPNASIGIGCIYMYSTELMGNYYLPVNGGKVYGDIDLQGNMIANKAWQSGTTENRPTNPEHFQEYFDTSLGRPVWWDERVSEWIDPIATGGAEPPVPKVVNQIPLTSGAYVYNTQDPNDGYVAQKQQFHAGFSNILYNADKEHTVNVALGNSSFWSGSVSSLFSGGNTILAPTTVENPIVIEIILDEEHYYIPEVGITFSNARIPRFVKIEFTSSPTSTAYELLYSTTTNNKYFVNREISLTGAIIGRLRITLADGIVHPTLNPQGTIGVGAIYMYQIGSLGNYYLPKAGGKVFGAIDMNTQMIQNKVWHNGTTAQRPTVTVPFQEFYDTTLRKPIWRNAANNGWVDANGTTV